MSAVAKMTRDNLSGRGFVTSNSGTGYRPIPAGPGQFRVLEAHCAINRNLSLVTSITWFLEERKKTNQTKMSSENVTEKTPLVKTYEEEDEELTGCGATLPCNPRRPLHRYLILIIMCFLSFGECFTVCSHDSLSYFCNHVIWTWTL